MAPYDVPHVTHDMILRFMGMNFSAVLDGSARIASSLGNEAKPLFGELGETNEGSSSSGGAKTPEQESAMREGMCCI